MPLLYSYGALTPWTTRQSTQLTLGNKCTQKRLIRTLGDRGSGFIFSCDAEMKVPIAGDANTFYRMKISHRMRKILKFEF